MKTRGKIKKEFKKFFEENPEITSIPYICTVVVPKYESTGERLIMTTIELTEYESVVENYYKGPKVDWEQQESWDIATSTPKINKRDAFYQFGDDTLVVAKLGDDGKVELEEIDYSEEIWDWW